MNSSQDLQQSTPILSKIPSQTYTQFLTQPHPPSLPSLPSLTSIPPPSSPSPQPLQQPLQLQQLLRSKISHYLTSQPFQSSQILAQLTTSISTTKRSSKLITSYGQIPSINTIKDIITKKKQINHIYRQKIQNGFQQCFIFYLELLKHSIKYQYKISSIEINRQKSILIDVVVFIVESLVEIVGMEKITIYFCVKGIRLGQIYGRMMEIGRLLFVMGCVTRRMQRYEQSIIYLKKALQYCWISRTPQTLQKQLQIYSILSHSLLQTNQPHQSKIFAYKYQIGYTQKNTSKIIELSNELIKSVQNRKNKWHSITEQSIQLLFQFNVQKILRDQDIRKGMYWMNQKKIIGMLGIGWEFMYEGFVGDDMFFYQVPMPLEIVHQQKPKIKKKYHQTKFLIKKRSSSMSNIRRNSQTQIKVLKQQHEKPKQFLLFNYRGIGVSKDKLSTLFLELVRKVEKIVQEDA